jgi:DNA primase
MKDNRDSINQIKESIDIVTVVERNVKLRKAGKNYSGLCPFHNEKTPSFIVSPDIQRFKCFGCGKSGDIFNFVQEIEGLEFPEALKKLADEAGVQLEDNSKPSKYKKIDELNDLAAKYFVENLSKNKQAKEYLSQRGLSDESLEKFLVGLSGSYNSFYKYIQSLGIYSKDEMLKSGLFTEKEGKVKDRFVNRIMFPIRSSSGRIIAFSGRKMPGDDFGPKYLNTPETPVFQKRETLFGLYESKNSIRKSKFCILCEGQTDVISAFAIGIENIVAPLGTGLTEQQIEMIKRYAPNILFFFDSDKAGQEAVSRGFKIAAKKGVNTYAVTPPSPHKDIDELIQADKDLAIKLSKPKLDAFTYLINRELEKRDLNNLKDYNFLVNYGNELIEEVESQDIKNYYLKKIKFLTQSNSNEQSGTFPSEIKTPQIKKDTRTSLTSDPELYFLALILSKDLSDKVDKIDTKYFRNLNIAASIEYLKKHNDLKVEQILENEDLDLNIKNLIEGIIFNIDSLPEELREPRIALNDVYLRIKSDYYARMLELVRKQQAIAESEGNDEKADDLLAKAESISNIIQQLKV